MLLWRAYYLGRLAEYLFGNKNAKALQARVQERRNGLREKEATKKPGKMRHCSGSPNDRSPEALSYLSVSL